MKKNKIRLTLNRETLRNLAPEQIQVAEGGAIVVQTANTNCICPTPPVLTKTCPSQCGQWYCYGV